MNDQNFVSPEDGGFVVYFRGAKVGWFASQAEAENYFNQVQSGGGAGGNTGGVAPGSPGAYRPPMQQSGGGGMSMGSGGMSPALQQQLAAQAAMLDAQASGNREKFEEAQKQFEDAKIQSYIEMFGYDAYGDRRGSDGGGQQAAGAPTGSYNTKNGTKNVQQMRDELKAANWPNAEKATDQEVVTQYGQTTGQEATPGNEASAAGQAGGGGGGGVRGPNADIGAQLKQIYEAVKQKKGASSLSPRDPDLIAAAVNATGFSAEKIGAAFQKGQTYYVDMGQIIPDDVIGQMFNDEFPQGRNPSLPAKVQEWTQNRTGGRDAEDDRRWQGDFDERQRQFGQNQYSQMGQAILQAATNLRGPRDYARYQQMLGQGRGLMDQLSGSTPQAGFGMSGDVEPARVTDILEQMGMISRPAGGGGPQQSSQPWNSMPMPGGQQAEEWEDPRKRMRTQPAMSRAM